MWQSLPDFENGVNTEFSAMQAAYVDRSQLPMAPVRPPGVG